MFRTLVLALLASSASACFGFKQYTPLRVPLHAERAERASALDVLVRELELRVVRHNRHHTWVEAVEPSRGSLRNRFVLDTRRGALSVSTWTEMRGADGAWQQSSWVCEGYDHAREREVVERYELVLRRVRRAE